MALDISAHRNELFLKVLMKAQLILFKNFFKNIFLTLLSSHFFPLFIDVISK